jgi:hypothetical protein
VPIEVKNQDFFAFIGQFLGRDGNAVEEAKAAGFIGKSMVSGWAYEGKIALFSS